MRLELAGSLSHSKPLIITLKNGVPFIPATYLEMGYTNFDVICVGGGGGVGGSIDTTNTGTLARSYGGSGGGGGFHRTQGLLSALPLSCPVVVGAGGAPGVDQQTEAAFTTDGEDGGYSSFNDTTCRASGGKGGKRVQANSLAVSSLAHGGDGGAGDRILVGGGAAGGIAGIPTPTGPGTAGTPGADGVLVGDTGQGGGGAAGGVAKYGGGGVTCVAATASGRGSYNPGDTSVYGPGSSPTTDVSTGAHDVVPGAASGAKASPVNGLPYVYGRSSQPGAVIIQLIAA